MSQFKEVAETIICDAYAEPTSHWAYRLIKSPADTPDAICTAAEELADL